MCCAESLSCVWLFVTPWTVACQAPLSMGILQVRILEWVAKHSSRGSSNPGIKPSSPEMQADSLSSEPPGKPIYTHTHTHTHTYIYMYVYGSYIQAHIHTYIYTYIGFPGGARVVKNLSANARDTGLIPGSGRSSGEGNVNPLQYSCLENSMDRGAWKSIVHRVSKSWTLSDKHWVYTFYVMNSSTEY